MEADEGRWAVSLFKKQAVFTEKMYYNGEIEVFHLKRGFQDDGKEKDQPAGSDEAAAGQEERSPVRRQAVEKRSGFESAHAESANEEAE
jgi:hypothetical protein